MSLLGGVKKFFGQTIWRRDLAGLAPFGRALVFIVRSLVLAARGYRRHQVAVWASALTYITLISIVPFVGLVIGVGFQFGVPEKALDSAMENLPQVQAEFLQGMIERFRDADLKALGIVAIVVLLYAIVKALSQVEAAFNRIWGVKKGRSLLRRVTNYVSVTVLGSLLMLSAMALTASLMSSDFVHTLESLPVAGWLFNLLVRAFPYLSVWMALTALYSLMPNTKVRIGSALAGALVAGVLWQILQKAYLSAQVGITRIGVVYGAFAAIPIFLVWVYASWLIVLLGTEICYGTQHASAYAFERGELRLSEDSRERAALRVALLFASRFEGGQPPLDADEIAVKLEAPVRLVDPLLERLTEAGILHVLEDGKHQVAMSPRRITAADVMNAIRRDGEVLPAGQDDPEGSLAAIADLVERVDATLEVTLADLLEAGAGLAGVGDERREA